MDSEGGFSIIYKAFEGEGREDGGRPYTAGGYWLGGIKVKDMHLFTITHFYMQEVAVVSFGIPPPKTRPSARSPPHIATSAAKAVKAFSVVGRGTAPFLSYHVCRCAAH